MVSSRRSDRSAWIGAAAVDVAAVVVFAAAGRSSHDENSDAGTIITIAAPFLVGLMLGWIVSPAARRDPGALRTGLIVWASTLLIGLPLRRTVWDRGTAVSFVIVAAVLLATLFVGWRAMWRFARRQREIRSASPP